MTDRRSAISNFAIAGAAVLFAFLSASTPIRNSDVWRELAVGRSIANGTWSPGIDPFAYTTVGQYWTNHSWLYDLALYSMYQLGGGAGLVLLRGALVAVAAVIMLRIRHGDGMGWPAVGVVLAVLASNGRLVMLQPLLASALMLIVLLCVLHRPPSGWKLPAVLGVLGVVWVNLDVWYVLGPALVLLWLLGAIVNRFTGITDGASIRHLAVGLLAISAAALVSPHTFHIPVWPDDLVPGLLSVSAQSDPLFANYLVSPFSFDYPDKFVGWPAAIAYYVLIVAGLASFLANTSGWNWSRLFVWVGLAALSAARWRLVPFFAVVAGPMLAINMQHVAQRMQWDRLTLPGRWAGGVAALALCVFTVPGLLSLNAGTVLARRIGWTIQPDEALMRTAERLQAFHDAGQFTSSDHGFNLELDLAHYCAWFAPSAKSFFDNRLQLFAPVADDYLQIRRGVIGQTQKDDAPLQELLRKHGVTNLTVAVNERRDFRLSRRMWMDPKQWPVLALVGRNSIFAWIDPAGGSPDRSSLKLNLVKLAFGPPAPATAAAGAANDANWWSSLFPKPPQQNINAQQAAAYLELLEANVLLDSLRLNIWGNMTGVVGGADMVTGSTLFNPIILADLFVGLVGSQAVLGGQAEAAAAPVLAYRAAHQAIVEDSNDPESYLLLAQAVRQMEAPEALKRWQTTCAYRQSMDRAQFAALRGRRVETIQHDAARGLFDSLRAGERVEMFDVAVEALKTAVELFPRVGAGVFPPEAFKQRLEADQQLFKTLQDRLSRLRDEYELKSAGVPARERVTVALQYGLAGEALKLLENLPADEQGPNQVLLRIQLLIQSGRSEEAHAILRSPQFHPLTQLQPPMQAPARTLAVQAAAAVGDLQSARDELTTAIDTAVKNKELQAKSVGALLLLLTDPDAIVVTRVFNTPAWLGLLNQQRSYAQSQATLQTLRATITLQEGDTPAAKKYFTAASNASSFVGPPQEAALSNRYLKLLTAAQP